MLFQLRTNGPPGFLRPFMTDDGRFANISFIYPDHKGDTIMKTLIAADAFITKHPMGEVIVRLDKDQAEAGAPLWNCERLTDIWYYMLGPLLPARHHTLTVQIRQPDGSYKAIDVIAATAKERPARLARRVPREGPRGLRERARRGRGGRRLHLARARSPTGTTATSTTGGRARSTASAPSR